MRDRVHRIYCTVLLQYVLLCFIYFSKVKIAEFLRSFRLNFYGHFAVSIQKLQGARLLPGVLSPPDSPLVAGLSEGKAPAAGGHG